MIINYCVPKIEYIYVTKENAVEVLKRITQNGNYYYYSQREIYEYKVDIERNKCYLLTQDLTTNDRHILEFINLNTYYVNEREYDKGNGTFIDNWESYQEWEFNDKYVKIKGGKINEI